MLYFNYIYENAIAPSANTNNNTNEPGWKKWILPAAAIAGAGLLGYGGYKIYNHNNEVFGQQLDVNNVQRIVHQRRGEEQALENMKAAGASQDDLAVKQNQINVLKNQENIEKRNFRELYGDNIHSEVQTDPDFQSEVKQ